MPDSTTRLVLPRPVNVGDAADARVAVGGLADSLDPRAVIFLRDTFANLPTSFKDGRFFYATDTDSTTGALKLGYDDGTLIRQVVLGDDPRLVNARAPSIPLVTTLPTGGAVYEGKVVRYQTSGMAAIGIEWLLVYVGAEATYKWHCIGGRPWVVTGSGPAISSGGYQGGGSSPAVANPLAGVYWVEASWRPAVNPVGTNAFDTAAMSYTIGGSAALDADATFATVIGNTSPTPNPSGHSTKGREKTLAANTTLAAQFRWGANTLAFSGVDASLSIMPKYVI